MIEASIVALSPAEVIVRGGDALRDWHHDAKVKVPGHQFTPRYKRRQWDGYYLPGKYLRAVPGGGWEFRGSRGLLPRIAEVLPVPGTLAPPLSPDAVASLKARLDAADPPLRDYQRKAVTLVLTRGWGRISLATNAGKGAIMALICGHLREQGVRSLVLCDEIAVFEALRGEIRQWLGEEPALVESGIKEPPAGKVALAMVRTLSLRVTGKNAEAPVWRDWLQGFECMLLDEADKASAKTWKEILRHSPQTTYRAGFSGTFPTDAHGSLIMDELMGPKLLEIKNMALVEREISARPRVLLHGFDATRPARHAHHLERMLSPEEREGRTGADRRRLLYELAVVENLDRHRFITELIRPGVPTCVIVNRVEHGYQLEEHLPAAVFLSGKDPKEKRTAVLEAFRAGSFQTLVVTKILDRGTNQLGHVVDLIFASGEGSNRETLQRIGRGLRRADGKAHLRLIDIIDRGHRHLESAARKRIKLYGKEGFDVDVYRPGEEEQAGVGSGPGVAGVPAQEGEAPPRPGAG